MRTFAINTLGCKLNQYESQQIRELLEHLGLTQVEPADKPDLFVINTCCVTVHASAKSRQYLRKAEKLNPDAAIVAAGCLPTVQIGELGRLTGNIHLAANRDNLAALLAQISTSKTTQTTVKNHQIDQTIAIKTQNSSKFNFKNNYRSQANFSTLSSFKGHTRAFLKVQDGCDAYCSYCIIPKTRPNVQSKPLETVLKEAKQLVEAGHKEIVVTGIFLGGYGQTSARRTNWAHRQNDELADLLEKLAQIPNLARIRLSSLEPGDVTERLLDIFCKYPNIMPHLHLSLQSGSNNVLKKMGRQYTADGFRAKIELIKTRLDRPAITCDFIVGFPGENDGDFEETVDLAKEVGFAKMHVFGFSARKDTAAATMQDTVNVRVIKQRSQLLRDLAGELGNKFREQFVGQGETILIENPSCSADTLAAGRSERYFRVQVEKAEQSYKPGDLVRVKLIKNREDGMTGRSIKCAGFD
ncbi:MAG: tRNA (N(6)-L-threonylcarbamoyladenosine(37)-C(2))-methylthiotransferase MtaB [Planctomycetota bacterium]|jgi:threonylcarbamoyladenosine tRNA methylthiotransferase MtaB